MGKDSAYTSPKVDKCHIHEKMFDTVKSLARNEIPLQPLDDHNERTGNTKYWQGCGKIRTHVHCWEEWKMVCPL